MALHLVLVLRTVFMRLGHNRMVPRPITLSLLASYVLPDKLNPGYGESQIMGLDKEVGSQLNPFYSALVLDIFNRSTQIY